MEMIYLVSGLDCANCAREFEEKIKNINGVNEATVNLLTRKVIVNVTKDVSNELNSLAHNFEDGLSLKRIK